MEVDQALRLIGAFRPKDLQRGCSKEFYQAVVHTMAVLCSAPLTSLYLVSDDRAHLELVASLGLSQTWMDATRRIPIGTAPGCGTCGQAAALKRVVISDHSEPAWDPLRERAAEEGLASSWSVPLLDSNGEVIGTFASYHTEKRAPTPDEIQHAQIIAQEAAHIIEVAHLFGEQQAALELNNRAQELAQQLVSHSSPDAVFNTMTQGLKELIDADLVWLQYQSASGDIRLYQSEEIFVVAPLRLPDSPCREALERRQAIESYEEWGKGVPTRRPFSLSSMICHPIELNDGQVVICAGWQDQRPISHRERRALELFTKFSGIALQNATRYHALHSAYFSMARGFLIALEERDFETIAHSRRVVTYTMLLAEHFSDLEGLADQIALGAALHDVGKIGIPDNILKKPGKLSQEEFEIVRTHPLIGYRMLEQPLAQFPVALDLVRHHHERFDGNGYPDRLKGTEISLGARLLALADAFDVMTTDRPYKKRKSIQEARAEVASLRGAQFCPEAVDALLSLSPDLLEAVQRGEVERSPFPTVLATTQP